MLLKMEFPLIEKCLGKEWLNAEIEKLQRGNWAQDPRNAQHVEIGFKILGKINELIGELKDIPGFDRWSKDARTTPSFKDFLPEIMVFQHLHRNTDSMEIKPSGGTAVPEAKITKGSNEFLIEVKRIDGLPTNIRAKVTRLFTDIRRQFETSQGIAFIVCPEFFINQHERLIPKPEFGNLILEVERRLLNPNHDRSIKAVFLVNVGVVTNLTEVFIHKHFFLVRRPENAAGISEQTIRNIMDVNGFVEASTNLFRRGIR